MRDFYAFRAGEEVYRALHAKLGAEEPAGAALFDALEAITRGCHAYHPGDKTARFGEARERASRAVTRLLLGGPFGDPVRAELAKRLEGELIPAIGRLIVTHERRGAKERFERFGRFGGGPGGRR